MIINFLNNFGSKRSQLALESWISISVDLKSVLIPGRQAREVFMPFNYVDVKIFCFKKLKNVSTREWAMRLDLMCKLYTWKIFSARLTSRDSARFNKSLHKSDDNDDSIFQKNNMNEGGKERKIANNVFSSHVSLVFRRLSVSPSAFGFSLKLRKNEKCSACCRWMWLIRRHRQHTKRFLKSILLWNNWSCVSKSLRVQSRRAKKKFSRNFSISFSPQPSPDEVPAWKRF